MVVEEKYVYLFGHLISLGLPMYPFNYIVLIVTLNLSFLFPEIWLELEGERK